MNVEIGAEAALFPEKEYISGIFVAVWFDHKNSILKFFYCEKSAFFQAEAAFRAVAAKFGLDYDAMCVSDNTACTE